MARLKSKSFHTVWLATGQDSKKIAHYLGTTTKAGLSFLYHHDSMSVVLTGLVEVLEKPNLKEELWSDWMLEHFSGGPQAHNYCVLKFTTRDAIFWIDDQFETYRYKE